jgi:hypothetical protein
MFGYPTMVGQLGELGVTPEGVQQALQPNVVAPELSGNIAPSPFGGTQGGFESPIGTFSTGASPDTWTPTPPAEIPQAPVSPLAGVGGPMADTLQEAYANSDIGSLPLFLSGGLGLPPSFTMDPATMAALNNAAQYLGISPAALGLNVMEESRGQGTPAEGPNWHTPGSPYYGLLQEAASQNPAYTVLDSPTAAALHAGQLSDEDQLVAYLQQWLPGYNIPNRMADVVSPWDMSIPQQAAMMQGLQFAPNSSAWLRAVAGGDQGFISTKSPQATNLGNNSYGVMTAAFQKMLAANPPMLGTGGAGAFVGPPMIQ